MQKSFLPPLCFSAFEKQFQADILKASMLTYLQIHHPGTNRAWLFQPSVNKTEKLTE